MEGYREFLESKVREVERHGFACEPIRLSKRLFAFQRDIVLWALDLGRACIFADTGLGKSFMELAWGEQVARHTGKPVILLTPLAVAPQMAREAKRFSIEARVVSDASEVAPGVNITNYQKLDKFDSSAFSGVILDENPIQDAGGKRRWQIQRAFADTPFKLSCTATPAPNDYLELGTQAQFLGLMDLKEMMTRWFVSEQGSFRVARLKGHGRADFWRWVASWSVTLTHPSDLGYRASRKYELPPLTLHEHPVKVDVTVDAGDRLYRDGKLTATTVHKELRLTCDDRAKAVAELVRADRETWVVWCHTDYESDALAEAIPEAVEVRGSTPDEKKERLLSEFSEGKHRILITKPSIAGFGLNWQHCARQAFVGLSYSWQSYYQAIRRSWRFGQARPVEAHLFFAETEGDILGTIKRKEAQALDMRSEVVAVMKENWKGDGAAKEFAIDFTHRVERDPGGRWEVHLGDCVEVASKLADESVDFSVFSPPFVNLYTYSESLRDMGNSLSDEQFFRHYDYLAKELLRATVEGRLCAIHCKDLALFRNRDEAIGLKDFPGMLTKHMTDCGWVFHSRVCIWKCPVTERERTNNNGLLHKTVRRDSSQIRQGMADYLLVFRKNPSGEANESRKPIERPDGFVGPYAGTEDPSSGLHPSPYARKASLHEKSIEVWRRYAEPVWWDVSQVEVLNYEVARTERDEKHICPLQLGVIERAIELWTNPGDLVLSPFAGIGSEGYVAVKKKRRFLGIELKDSYFEFAAKHLRMATEESMNRGLFDDFEESVEGLDFALTS